MLNHVAAAPISAVRITGDHGYRIEGDTAFLNAELDISGGIAGTSWALQLWACDNPHSSGPIVGTKVAEAPVVLGRRDATVCRLEVATFAAVPARRRDYAMVLVLASGAPGSFEQVRDFANYPMRQSFDVPNFDGALGYAIEDNRVLLRAERVANPRGFGTSSGTLALELWTTREPHLGGSGMNGQLLARAMLGELAGQGALEHVEQWAELTPPLLGDWNIALVLSEWTAAAGFVVRDYCNFAAPHRQAALPPQADVVVPCPNGVSHDSGVSADRPVEIARPEPAPMRRPTHDEIAFAAYYRFLARGDGPGTAEEDWLAAERELTRA